MTRSALSTILLTAVATVLGTGFLVRLKQKDPESAVVQTRPMEVLQRPSERELLIESVESQVKKPEPEAANSNLEPVYPEIESAPMPGPPPVDESNGNLAAGVLPSQFTAILARGVIPNSEDFLTSSEIARRQEKTIEGDSLEFNIRSFVASQPQAKTLKVLVSCGAQLCEIQLEQIQMESGATAISEVSLRLEAEPWFGSALALVRRGQFVKDGHPYFVGYWRIR